jgi:outer membrane protein
MMFLFLIFLTFDSNASIIRFQDYYQSMMKKNNTYWGAIYGEQSAFERNEGTLGLYMPTLTAGFSDSSTDTLGVEGQTRSKTVSLAGNIPQFGLGYSTNLYGMNETIKPTPRSYSGTYDFGLTLNLLKDFGPRVGWIPFKQAELNLDSSKLSKLKTIYALSSQMLSAYVGAYASQKNLLINSETEVNNQESLRKAQAQFNAGKIPKLSLLTIQAQAQQLRSQVIGVERSLRDSMKNLLTLSSLNEAESTLDLSSKLEPIKMPFFNEKIIDKLVLKKISFKELKNPDYLLGKITLEQAEFSVIQAKNNIFPSLNLAYTVTGNETNTTQPGLIPVASHGKTIALNFSMPLGMVTERREMAAVNLEYQKSLRDFEQLKIQLERDWENITNNYRLLKNQVEIARLLVQAAKEKYEAALPTASLGTTYQQNVVSFQNELVSFQTNLNQLEVEFISAQFSVLTFHAHPHIYEVFSQFGLK